MRFKSNLECPDISACFDLLDPPLQMCGHDVPTDPDYEPGCGFWTHDEAAILCHVVNASRRRIWIDVGARFGWTAAHMVLGGATTVFVIDPAYASSEYVARLDKNIDRFRGSRGGEVLMRGAAIWRRPHDSAFVSLGLASLSLPTYGYGVVIDGNHDAPEPLNDAKVASDMGSNVILLHDYVGRPVREAGDWLSSHGFKRKIYYTPNGVGLFWRDIPLVPPDHHPDPVCVESVRARIEQDGGTV